METWKRNLYEAKERRGQIAWRLQRQEAIVSQMKSDLQETEVVIKRLESQEAANADHA